MFGLYILNMVAGISTNDGNSNSAVMNIMIMIVTKNYPEQMI